MSQHLSMKYIYLLGYRDTIDFPNGSAVKNPLSMQEMHARSLHWEDPQEKEMAINFHSPILVWEIPWTEEAGGLQSKGLQSNQTWLSD